MSDHMYDDLYSLGRAHDRRALYDYTTRSSMPFAYEVLRLYEKLRYLPQYHDVGSLTLLLPKLQML